MSKTKYEDGCKGCEPAGVDMNTGKRLPPEHPMSVGMLVAWEKANRKTRKAWHATTCLNSRRPGDLRLVAMFRQSMMFEMRAAENRAGACIKRDPKDVN